MLLEWGKPRYSYASVSLNRRLLNSIPYWLELGEEDSSNLNVQYVQYQSWNAYDIDHRCPPLKGGMQVLLTVLVIPESTIVSISYWLEEETTFITYYTMHAHTTSTRMPIASGERQNACRP